MEAWHGHKVYLFSSVGTKKYFTNWFWLRWGPSSPLCYIECLIHAAYTPHNAGAVNQRAQGGIPLFNGCEMMAVVFVRKMWQWCAGSLCACVGVHMFIVYRAAVTLWTAVYKGFPWRCAPYYCSRGPQNEVKLHLLQPCRVKYLQTGKWQVYCSKKVLMEWIVNRFVLCFL